jgi:hypothetical protein
LFGTPQPLLKHWQSVPSQLSDLLGLCLAEPPAERPADFGVVLRYLEHAEDSVNYGLTSVEAAPSETPAPASRGDWKEQRQPATRPAPATDPRTRRASAKRSTSRSSAHTGAPPWLPAVLVVGGVVLLVGTILLAVWLSLPSQQDRGAAHARPLTLTDPNWQSVAAPANGSPQWGPLPAAPLPPDLEPKGHDPENVRVYLSDLKELAVCPSPPAWTFGKHGWMGSPTKDRVSYKGWVSYKGLSTHPTAQCGGVKYLIEPAEVFETWVGINDSAGEGGSAGDIVFVVLGDDKELWRSQPVRKMGSFQECRVLVHGVKVLDLRAYPPEGSFMAPHGGGAVWLDPYITRPKKDSAEK